MGLRKMLVGFGGYGDAHAAELATRLHGLG
jgi:hypothetical protein